MGGLIHRMQHLGIDLVALGQRLIQIQRTNRGADIGHHQIEDGHFQLRHFIRSLGRIQHLEIDHAIDFDHRVVLGNHVLTGHVHHLLHHVDLAPHAVHDRHQKMQTRRHRVGIPTKALHRPFVALRHHPHGLGHTNDPGQQ